MELKPEMEMLGAAWERCSSPVLSPFVAPLLPPSSGRRTGGRASRPDRIGRSGGAGGAKTKLSQTGSSSS